MPHSQIDRLTRFVARRTGRRTLTVGALGGLLATLVPSLNASNMAARKKPRCRKPKRLCGTTCVNLKNNRRHCGKCGRTCKPGHLCQRGKCVRPCGKGGACRVFVTASLQPGNLGGLAGADAICTRSAREAQLPGTYKAWLSTQFDSPAGRFSRNPGPYVLTDGTRVANTWADLTDGSLLAPIQITEHGQPVDTIRQAWTATSTSGTLSNVTRTCTNWTSIAEFGAIGIPVWEESGWTSYASSACSEANHVYCFQKS